MVFDELNEAEWALVSALIGCDPDVGMNRRGRPRVESRSVANAVLWILTTREPWSNLPSHYPSGPTCRRRFAEWRANGVLEKIAHALARTGRMLPSTAKRPSPVASSHASQTEQAALSVDTWGRVIWKSADSWKAPVAVNGGRTLDAIACMTHQLSGASGADPDDSGAVLELQHDALRSSMLKSLCRHSIELDDEGGYVVCAGFEQLSNGTYRAWTEIMKDRRRIERSGLIGPRFFNAEAAQQHALEWGRQWIAHQHPTSAEPTILDVAVMKERAAIDAESNVSTDSLATTLRATCRCGRRKVTRGISDRSFETTKPCAVARCDRFNFRPTEDWRPSQ